MRIKPAKIDAAIRRNRLQMKVVAAGIGVSTVTLYNWRSRRAVPTDKNLRRLVRFLRQYERRISIKDFTNEIRPVAVA
jgi:DNA-binding transcriptional regulator YiaG